MLALCPKCSQPFEAHLFRAYSAEDRTAHGVWGVRDACPPPADVKEAVLYAQGIYDFPPFREGGTMDKPSIGRIVIYNHPGSSDGKYPPQKSPAIIQNVAQDGTVRLFVFGPKGQHMDEGLTQGDGPCQWNWPDRV